MAAQKHLLHRGLFSAQEPGPEDEDQRFHGLPPLKRFKLLQKEKTHFPLSPSMPQDDRFGRPVQVCCLPAKKRVCALQFFASMADEEEETDDKENEMAPFKKIIRHSFASASPPSDPAILHELASNNSLKLASDISCSELNSKIPKVRSRSTLGPLNTSLQNVSALAQKNAECNKKMIRPSESDKLRESEKEGEAKKTPKLSKVSEETAKKTITNSVQSSSKLMKTDKGKTEKRHSKEEGRHISSKKEVVKENVEVRERKREEATYSCLKMEDGHSSLSRKRDESVSRGADEKMKLMKGDMVNEKDLRLIDAKERKREELTQVSSRRENGHSSSSKGTKNLDSTEGGGDLRLKKREPIKERDGRLSDLIERNAEGSQKINLKKKDDLSLSEKRKILETKVCLKKKAIFVNEKESASVCHLKKDGDDHQLADLKKIVVNRDSMKLKGEEYPSLKLCLKKKKRIQLKEKDPSKLCVEKKVRLKSKLCVNKENQFKRNSPLKISVDNKDQFKRHNSLNPCVENKDKVKGHDSYFPCVEKKDKSCSEENEVNVCCLKKARLEETMGSYAVSVVKGHYSNGETQEFSKDQNHHSSNVLEDCTKSDKDCYTGEYNTCKESQNAHGEEDGENKGVGENEDEEDGVFCDVCMEEDADEEDPIVFCDGCNVMVHASCYGYPLIDGIPDGDWFCKQCMEKKSKQNTLNLATDTNINGCDNSRICCLCPKREGAMKETTGGGWAHLSCALFVPEVFYRKAREREEIECSQVPSWRWNLPCIFCKKDTTKHNNTTDNSETSFDGCGKGACIQCTEVGCTSTFHVSCAMDAGLSLDIRIGNGVSKTPAIVIAFCPAHTQQALSGSERRRFKIVPRD